MQASELKKIADENGIDYHKNANAATMQKILAEHDIHIGSSEDVVETESGELKPAPQSLPKATMAAPQSYTNFDHKLKEAVSLFKAATTSLELNRANQQRHILKEQIKREGNQKALAKLLKWERAHKQISKVDDYLLNEMEKDAAEGSCLCATRIPASGTHTQEGKVYPFTKYYDESRESDVFVVFVDRTIEPEAQIGRELDWKMKQGFMPEMKDYAPAKTVWHRLPLRESEFRKYFRVEGEEEVFL